VYNDNVNSPEIRDWLGKVVGREAEDLSRHDKWLCMMLPRLILLRKFLRSDGVICVSIGDDEIHHLKRIMDEIFGSRNFRNLVVVRRFDKNLTRQFMEVGLQSLSVGTEYLLVYARTSAATVNAVFREPSEKRKTSGYWKGFWNAADRPTMRYELLGVKPENGQWKWEEEKAREAVDNYNTYLADFLNNVTLEEYWKATGEEKRFIRRTSNKKGKNKGVEHWVPPSTGVLLTSNWTDLIASESLDDMGVKFDNPKNREYIKRVIQFTSGSDALILDSFAGSGTTAHAVLQLNGEDGGNRKFILVEMEEKICREITAERVKRVAQGYTNSKGKFVEGLGGGFRYCTLGDTLFDADGQIRESVTFSDLARHIFLTETGEPLPKQNNGRTPLLGVVNGTAYYLLYNGIMGDKRAGGGNVLTRAVLAELPEHDGPKVIFGTGCRLSGERMGREQITFKQLPYELRINW
jgi:hypothetical protein